MNHIEQRLESLSPSPAGPPPKLFLEAVRTKRRRRHGGSVIAAAVLSLAVGLAIYAPWQDAPSLPQAPLVRDAPEPQTEPTPLHRLTAISLSQAGANDLPSLDLAPRQIPTAFLRHRDSADLLH